MYIIEQEILFSYEDILRYALKLQDRYKPLLQLKSIGYSHDNRELLMLDIGYGKYSLICTGGVHGRENINPMVLLEMAENYCKAYYGNNEMDSIDIKSLLRTYTISMIPLLNPDGYEIASYGCSSIRNQELRERCLDKQLDYRLWKFNGRGVDINRNFKSKSFVPNRHMLSPNSENEAKALVKVFTTKPSIGYLDFHSRGDSIFYYRKDMSHVYNERQLKYASYLSKIAGFTLEEPENEMDENCGGNTVHYYAEYIRQPSITIETIPEEEQFPLSLKYLKIVSDHINTLPLHYLKLHKEEMK